MRKLLIILAAAAVLLSGCSRHAEEATLPPPETNPYTAEDFTAEDGRILCLRDQARTGIDVSTHQEEIDWQAVAADGIDFAIIRVGYRTYLDGRIREDANARANIEGALAAGLDVGVYFFSQALTPQEAAQEAAFLISFIEEYPITMPVVFDWEHVESADARTADFRDRDLLTRCALTFLQTVDAAGYRPMVYFNRYQARDLLDLRVLKDYDFWLAAYDTAMDFPWQVRMWQYTESGTVAGIDGNVDLNLYFP